MRQAFSFWAKRSFAEPCMNMTSDAWEVVNWKLTAGMYIPDLEKHDTTIFSACDRDLGWFNSWDGHFHFGQKVSAEPCSLLTHEHDFVCLISLTNWLIGTWPARTRSRKTRYYNTIFSFCDRDLVMRWENSLSTLPPLGIREAVRQNK